MFYDKTTNTDEDMRVPLLTTYNSSNIYIPIETDFTERVYIYQYFGMQDIMQGVGALNAFIIPIIAMFTPYFIIYFLYSLSKILWYKYE